MIKPTKRLLQISVGLLAAEVLSVLLSMLDTLFTAVDPFTWVGAIFFLSLLIFIASLIVAIAAIIVSIWKTDPNDKYRALPTILTVCISACVMFFAFCNINIAMLRGASLAKQSEAKQSLAEIYKAQQSYHSIHGRYAATFGEMGWKPYEHHRYNYFISKDAEFPITDGNKCGSIDECGLPFKARPFVGPNAFKIYAVANDDNDEVLDVWSIDNNKNRVNEVNDIQTESWDQWREKLK
jgi:hypothetical protein